MQKLHQMKKNVGRVKHTILHYPASNNKLIFISVESSQQRIEKLQDEVIKIQIKYQRELEKLERENKELRKQNLLLKGGRKPTNRQIKVIIKKNYSIFF